MARENRALLNVMSTALTTADAEIAHLKEALAELTKLGPAVSLPPSPQSEATAYGVDASGVDSTPLATPEKLRTDEVLRRGELEQRLWTAFTSEDRDHSGALSKRELYKALGKAGVTGSHAQLLHIFQAADANHDGTVDWPEFLSLGEHMHQLSSLDAAALDTLVAALGRASARQPLTPAPSPGGSITASLTSPISSPLASPVKQPGSVPPTPQTAAALEAKGTLKLRLKSGEGLKSMDDNGLSDPYVKFLVGKKSVTSKMVKKTLNPQWNEELALKNVTLGEVLREPMSLQCWDWDFMKSDDPMGVGSLDLQALGASLEAGADVVVSLDDGQPTAGRVSLWVQWVPKEGPTEGPVPAASPRSPHFTDGARREVTAALEQELTRLGQQLVEALRERDEARLALAASRTELTLAHAERDEARLETREVRWHATAVWR